MPLLKGRRTSKIRPEFVIFDPQSQETLQVFDDMSQCPSYSDGSDTEKDTADLCGSPRYRKKNRKKRDERPSDEATEREEKPNDLSYVDTLPEVIQYFFFVFILSDKQAWEHYKCISVHSTQDWSK